MQVDAGDVSNNGGSPPHADVLFRQVFDARAFTPLPFSAGPIEAPAHAFPTVVVAVVAITIGATLAIRAAPGALRSFLAATASSNLFGAYSLPQEEDGEARSGAASYVPLQ
eukprot:scaffold182561_cov36-Tisochrysis_lutea.AAC.9